MQENSTINLLRSLDSMQRALDCEKSCEDAMLGLDKTVPRVLQSADEAPCGSLIHRTDIHGTQGHTLRLWNGNGWNVIHDGGLRHRGEGWPWGTRVNGPATLLAEGLTEDECRHLSGLSAADAIAWCEKRQAALHVPTTCDKDTTYWLQVAKERAESTAAAKGGVLEATRTALRTEPDACIIRTAEQVRALADEALQVHAGAAAKARGQVAAREELKAVVPAPAAPGKPGDVVPWADVEDGAIYAREPSNGFPFRMVTRRSSLVMTGPGDRDIERMLLDMRGGVPVDDLAGREEGHTATLVARDLGTDPEAWRRAMCEWTENGNKPAAPTQAVSKERYEITLDKVRQELGASPGDDIVSHARKVKARAVENERMLASLAEITATADRRLSLMLDADERESRIRDALGACETESIEDAIRRVMHEHELDLKTAAFEIKHLRDERDEARGRVDSLRRHVDPDRPPES